MGLQHQHTIIPVGHKAWQVVALGMDKPKDIGLFVAEETECHAIVHGGMYATTKYLFNGQCSLVGIKGEHFADDALVLEVTHGHPLTACIDNIDEVTFLRVSLDAFYRAREYPRMTAKDGLLLAKSYNQFGSVHILFSASRNP